MNDGMRAEGKRENYADEINSIKYCFFHTSGLSFLCLSFCMLLPSLLVGGRHADRHDWSAEVPIPTATSVAPSYFNWVALPSAQANGACMSATDCCADIICYALEYTPGVTGEVTSYTTGFFTNCLTGMTPIVSSMSCTMNDNSFAINECMATDSILFNCSGNEGAFAVTTGVPVILHQVCFSLSPGQTIVVSEDDVTDLTLSIDLDGGGHVDEFPEYTTTTLSRPVQVWPPDQAITIACLSAATEPTPPTVYDDCNNLMDVELFSVINSPDPLTCEGFRIFIFQYTDCADNTHLWYYYYFIEYQPFTVPADGGETIACLNEIDVNLVVPPVVNDNCGIPLTPSGPSAPVFDPGMITCDGTVTYSWTYMDCEGNMASWDYVYTIMAIAPTQTGGPVDIDSTITCGLDGFPPMDLPTVVDQCGEEIPAPSPTIGGTYSGGCDGTITYTYVYSVCPGQEYIWTYTYTVQCAPIALRVFLEGPYDASGDTMYADLNLNHVLPGQDKLLSPNGSVQLSAPFTPFGQPYTISPWNYIGNSGLGFGDASAPGAPMGVVPYPDDVVDWILVTVRENGMLPADNIWSCAGWVHTDGHVTFPEDCGPLPIDIMDDYYVLIQHRNHLGVLSPSSVNMPCGSSSIEWDFTASNSYEPIFRVGQKQMEPGIWAMHAANGDQITAIAAIESNDRTTWRNLQNALGYSVGDYNMNVATNSTDETIWKFNQNKSSGIIFY